MSLTEAQIKKAAPGPRPYKLSDGRGLSLRVAVAGSKVFVKEYQIHGKRRTQTLGEFPAMRLADARHEAARITQLVKSGEDPRPQQPEPAVTCADDTAEFPEERRWETLCEMFIQKRVKEGIAEATENKLNWNLGATYELFGARDVATITGPEILVLIERVQETGKYEKAKDMRRKMSQVFQFAAARGHILHDPAHIIRNALVHKKSRMHPGLTAGEDVGALMRALRGFRGDASTRAGLLLSAYTVLRSTELRGALWKEIDFDERLWTVPQARMKKAYGEHLVPLSTQAVGVLEWLHAWTGGDPEGYVFRSNMYKDRHLSNATLNAALRRLGYDTREEHCQHGFRTTFSTNMNEQGWRSDWIEKQLAHYEKNEVRLAYNRAL